MPTTTMFRSPALASCPVCSGTGIDDVFASPCNCTKMIGTGSYAARAAADPTTNTITAPRTPGNGTGTGHSTPQRTNRYPGRCAVCAQPVAAEAGLLVREGQGWAIKCGSSDCRTIQGPVAAATPVTARSNRFAQACRHCGVTVPADTGTLVKIDNAWLVEHRGDCPTVTPVVTVGLDLTTLPRTGETTYFAVPGVDTRLKVRVRFPSTGTWAGWVFVDDGAEYGYGRKYGKQAPGQTYVGDIETELAAILAAPFEALRKYGEITSHCGICNRPLEDELSVARGIGPVCWRRIGGGS